jgi:hypothetical protein
LDAGLPPGWDAALHLGDGELEQESPSKGGRLSAFPRLEGLGKESRVPRECRHFKKGNCRHGEQCLFLHSKPPSSEASALSQALTEPLSPKEATGSSFSEGKAAEPTPQQSGTEEDDEEEEGEEKRFDTDAKLYTRAEFVEEYGGTEEWEAALELTVKPRFSGVVKVVLPYLGGSGEFAVVTDRRLFDVYVPGVFVKEWGIQRKDRVTGDMEPSNNARNPWKATIVTGVTKPMIKPEPAAAKPTKRLPAKPLSSPTKPAASTPPKRSPPLGATSVLSRKDKVAFITSDLELDPATNWPDVVRAAERLGICVGGEGNLGAKIDRLYKQLA